MTLTRAPSPSRTRIAQIPPTVQNLTPNWFATVMGTGIVATAAATLPQRTPWLLEAARVVWVLTALVLITLTIATVRHHARYPGVARSHHRHPVFAHFYGAIPMAVLTVGSGALLLGEPILGDARLPAAWTCWILGTVLGIACAALIPLLSFTGALRLRAEDAFGGWLMSVVPPMVSATGGALLAPTLPTAGQRVSLMLVCAALFGMSMIASLIIIGFIWMRLLRHGVGASAGVPTLWIVLGPLGQSVTAVTALAAAAHGTLAPEHASVADVLAVAWGVPVLGFALLWAVIAGTITVRTLRSGLPFSLTWWSLTFPVGTCVTGLSGLAARTGSPVLATLALCGYVVLVCAWAIVAVRTLRGALITRALLAAPVPQTQNTPS
ncbi:C4-dicarboxylate ABC transporter [Mycetocola tolaasinivorans]|uniref:C4-dicarboxylate ABC transporter n=1 Tax=Mycetocola tolaasinivorans TaxID=76635 RepID=A0A3L7A8N4_9MICO|nr:TDT family transporter [Mycetocola tolaasinivorans]RLP76766.1 C4-dicarboxylate ABC transporter [Mycetocola tolaasinivorans]